MDSKNAMKTWEMSNNMETIGSVDEIYRYDKKQQQDILTAKPWDKEYDSYIQISLKLQQLLTYSDRAFFKQDHNLFPDIDLNTRV